MDEQSEGASRPRIKVRDLVWTAYEEGTDAETFLSNSICGKYAAWTSDGAGYYNTPDSACRIKVGRTSADAMDAAQSDFERRVIGVVEIV